MADEFSFGTKRQETYLKPGAPPAQPARPGQTTARPLAAAPQMNPNPAAQPDPKPDMFGGTNDPAMNEWLNTQQGLLEHPRHPHLDYFLTGPFKGKTLGQMREKLIGDYRSGNRQGYGQPAGGLQSPTMTGKNSLTPEAEWQEKFKPRGIATVPQASPASPVQSAGMKMAKAGAAIGKPAMKPAMPAAPMMPSPFKVNPAPSAEMMAKATPAEAAGVVKAGMTPYGLIGEAAKVANRAVANAPQAQAFLDRTKNTASNTTKTALPGNRVRTSGKMPALATAAAAGPMSADGDDDALKDNDQDGV